MIFLGKEAVNFIKIFKSFLFPFQNILPKLFSSGIFKQKMFNFFISTMMTVMIILLLLGIITKANIK